VGHPRPGAPETTLQRRKYEAWVLLFEGRPISQATKHLRPLVAINPVSEELCCLLMKAYSGLGDRLAITKQYLDLKTALADELGLIPSAATRDLYYSLCGDEQDLVTLF